MHSQLEVSRVSEREVGNCQEDISWNIAQIKTSSRGNSLSQQKCVERPDHCFGHLSLKGVWATRLNELMEGKLEAWSLERRRNKRLEERATNFCVFELASRGTKHEYLFVVVAHARQCGCRNASPLPTSTFSSIHDLIDKTHIEQKHSTHW